MRFLFRLATGRDDAQLRNLMTTTPVPGSVTVAFEREPDFFAACPTMGECLVILAIEEASQRLAAAICLAKQDRWWDSEPRPVGYVGGLRVHPDFRGAGILTKAMPFIREAAANWGDIPWFTVIPAGNRSSEGLFVRNIRSSFPKLNRLCELFTLGLATGRHKRDSPLSGPASDNLAPENQPATADLPTIAIPIPGKPSVRLHQANSAEVADFMAGHKQELRPCWTERDFGSGSGLGQLRFLGASRDGRLVGTAAVWDQEAFKQSVVKAYSSILVRIRPLYNIAAYLSGFPALPDPGKIIRSAYLSCFNVPGTESQAGREVAKLLLRESIRLAGAMGKDFLMAGFPTGDPTLNLARRHRHISYHSDLYTFSFSGQENPLWFSSVSNPSVEIGTL